MPTRRMRLTVEVVVDDDDGGVLHGRIGCDGERCSDFTGWLGLLSSLDRLLTSPDSSLGSGDTPAQGTDAPP